MQSQTADSEPEQLAPGISMAGWWTIRSVASDAPKATNSAADLLRDHLASVGCDPVALRIVTELRQRAGQRGGLDDMTSHLPACHPVYRETHPGPLP